MNRFPKKSFKHSQESRYWKKFVNVVLEKEGESGGMARSDISFCGGSDKPNLMATAVSARVDIYKLAQPTTQDPDEDGIKPVQRIFKFKDVATSVKLRQDGNLVLCGEKTGRVQLIELNNKFILKSYEHEHANQVNSFDFKSTMREFISAANDTHVKVFDILEQQSVLTIHNAHADNVKKVKYVGDYCVLSGSADKTVRLWDLRNPSEALSLCKLPQPIEDFTFLDNSEDLVVANGAMMSILKLTNGDTLSKIADY